MFIVLHLVVGLVSAAAWFATVLTTPTTNIPHTTNKVGTKENTSWSHLDLKVYLVFLLNKL